MRRALGWMCWQIVMRWPGAWPSGAVAGWVLAWAGDYANEPPNSYWTDPRVRRSIDNDAGILLGYPHDLQVF